MVDLPIDEALWQAERLIPRAPYDEVIAALESCERMPDAAERQVELRGLRLLAGYIHERPDDEIEPCIVQYLKVAGHIPIQHRMSFVGAACVTRARLGAIYLPPLLAEARAAREVATTDQERRWLDEQIARTLRVCARLGVEDSIK